MIASIQFGDSGKRGTADKALGRVPEIAFGDTDWVRRALEACAEHLKPAIASGTPYRIANAVRAVAHSPSLQQLDAVIGAVCDAMLAEAYAGRNSRIIGNLAAARPIIDEVVAELRGNAARVAADPDSLRELVDGYLRLVALHDPRVAERLDATGNLTSRIAFALKLPASAVLEAELAGRLSDIATINLTRRSKQHTALGEAFVRSTPALSHLAPLVRSHHERYDGHGFPDGLRGEEIPFESRIIAVAAAFVDFVMGSARTKERLPSEACAELAARAGTEFDPDVVSAALHVLQFRRRTNRSA